MQRIVNRQRAKTLFQIRRIVPPPSKYRSDRPPHRLIGWRFTEQPHASFGDVGIAGLDKIRTILQITLVLRNPSIRHDPGMSTTDNVTFSCIRDRLQQFLHRKRVFIKFDHIFDQFGNFLRG